MNELEWLQERARRLCSGREPELSSTALDALAARHGPEAVLELRREIGLQLSGECFRAGLFSEAARWFRQRLTATQELADHLARAGDEEGAAREVEELARHAWAVGDLALFGRYVREGCEPERGLQPRLEVLPALFLSWAVLGRRFHPAHWRQRLDEAVGAERAELKARFQGAEREVARGLVVDSRRALCEWWLGDWDAAAAPAAAAAEAFRTRGRHRPEGLVVAHAREWTLRMEGLALLLEGRERPEVLEDATAAFLRALAASAMTRDVEWKDLVVLRLTALAWLDPDHQNVAAFRAAFPHLEILLAREREWPAEEAETTGGSLES